MPSLQHFRVSASTKRKLFILQSQYLRQDEPRPLQLIFQLSPHVEIVPSRRERFFSVGVEESLVCVPTPAEFDDAAKSPEGEQGGALAPRRRSVE